MAIEAGGKNGIIAPDAKTLEYVKRRTDTPFEPVYGDDDATALETRTYDVSRLEPTVARPHSPDKRAPARALTDVTLDRSYIGSCTGGKVTDFVAAAHVLKGKRVTIETFIVPATTEVDAALDTVSVDGASLRSIFADAGCTIGPASCAACLGGPPDTFGRANAALKVIATTNRNFPGRMGSKDAAVFLASPLTAAASAVAGHVADPRDYFDRRTPVGAGD